VKVDDDTECVLEAGWNAAPTNQLLPLRYLRLILDAVADPLVVGDSAARIVHVNRQAEVVFGYAQDELTGQPIDLLLGGQCKDGRRIPVEANLSSFEADGERFTTCVIRDASGRRDLDRRKDEFYANASHELRTPISTIKALTDVLLAMASASAPEGVDRLLGDIQREVGRMETLVDELLELGRLQAGAVYLRATQCDLREVVEQAAAAIQPLARKRLQVVELSVPDEPVVALVDAARLEQALLNLLSNAHKYSFEASSIRLKVEHVQTERVITVSDDGPGIPREDWERVFQRYYRSPDPAVRRVQGSGLGLAIARGIVELHGGRISVECPPESGAVFRIHLPPGSGIRPARMRSAHDHPARR
jgi:signal transduction histidine kinase